MLAYSLKLCMSLMQNKQFRNKVLRVLVKIYMNLEKPDFINVCQVITLYYFTLNCWVMPHYLMCVPHHITIISCIYLSIDLYNSPVKISCVFMFCFTDLKKLKFSKLKSYFVIMYSLCSFFSF